MEKERIEKIAKIFLKEGAAPEFVRDILNLCHSIDLALNNNALRITKQVEDFTVTVKVSGQELFSFKTKPGHNIDNEVTSNIRELMSKDIEIFLGDRYLLRKCSIKVTVEEDIQLLKPEETLREIVRELMEILDPQNPAPLSVGVANGVSESRYFTLTNIRKDIMLRMTYSIIKSENFTDLVREILKSTLPYESNFLLITEFRDSEGNIFQKEQYIAKRGFIY